MFGLAQLQCEYLARRGYPHPILVRLGMYPDGVHVRIGKCTVLIGGYW